MTTIGIIANKGGQGKTTIAVNLAHGLAMRGRKVLLVDCDDQGHIAVTFDVRTKDRRTLYDLLAQPAINPRDLMIELRPNLNAILSDETLYAGVVAIQQVEDDIQRLCRLRNICEELQSDHYDYVIFDGKPGQNDLVYNIILASHFLYLPVNVGGADFLGLAGLGTFLKAINDTCTDFDNDLGHWYERICLIPYFYRPREPDSQRDYATLTSKYPDLVTTPIRYSQALANAPRRGQTIFEYSTIYKNLGVEDFTKLIDLTITYETAKRAKQEVRHVPVAQA